jgi:hypothetical protein
LGFTARTPTADTWTTYSEEVTLTAAVGGTLKFALYTAGASATITAGDKFYLKNVILEYEGAIVDLDLGVGIGYQAHDRSTNELHATISASGVSHKVAQRRGQLRFSTSTSGNQQALAQVSIPGNSRLTSYVARAQSNTPSITVGTASGGSQIIASVALSTAYKEDFTFVTRLPSTAVDTTSSIWIGSSSSDVIEHCLSYEAINY